MTTPRKGWSRKRKAGTEVWFGQAASDIPTQEVADLSPEVFTTYSGPDQGLAIVSDLEPVAKDAVTGETLQNGDASDANSNSRPDCRNDQSRGSVADPAGPSVGDIAGGRQWNVKSRKAYGICMSLYEQHPINGKISGEPIADSFGVCARKNNSVMIVADGVNWGEKSKLAARCAVFGSMQHINKQLFGEKPITNTNEAFRILLGAIDRAHETIIQYGGGQTTLCLALVLPIRDSRQFAICIVNVGDSLAYVFSKYHGIREITTGSHDIQSERDIRDAGGAVGPVHGNDPELHNLTCSMTVADPGDIVYLTTDGISDNFDPVVTKIAVAKRRYSNPELQTLPEEGTTESPTNGNVVDSVHGRSSKCGTLDGKPEMEPHERHQYAVKEMERIIHEFELFTEQPCSAQELCGALLQHVLKLTDPKRKVLENPDLYGKKMKSKDRKRRDSEIIAKLSKSPGKLDHATIIGYEVGVYHGNDDEDYEVEEISDEEMDENLSPSPNPVSHFTFEEKHFADSDSSQVTASVARSNKHDSQGSACSPLSDTEPHNKHSLSPEGERSKKHAKALKNLKVKIRTRFKSPGRHKNRDRERSSDKSNSSNRSPSKSPVKSPVPYSPDVTAVQYSPEASTKSPNRTPPLPKGSIVPEKYMIRGPKSAPLASESDLHVSKQRPNVLSQGTRVAPDLDVELHGWKSRPRMSKSPTPTSHPVSHFFESSLSPASQFLQSPPSKFSQHAVHDRSNQVHQANSRQSRRECYDRNRARVDSRDEPHYRGKQSGLAQSLGQIQNQSPSHSYDTQQQHELIKTHGNSKFQSPAKSNVKTQGNSTNKYHRNPNQAFFPDNPDAPYPGHQKPSIRPLFEQSPGFQNRLRSSYRAIHLLSQDTPSTPGSDDVFLSPTSSPEEAPFFARGDWSRHSSHARTPKGDAPEVGNFFRTFSSRSKRRSPPSALPGSRVTADTAVDAADTAASPVRPFVIQQPQVRRTSRRKLQFAYETAM